MILHPAVIALTLGSAAASGLALYAAAWGLRILRRWDLASGSEAQLALEKRTYLVSTLMAWTCAFQFFSLFLFIFTAEELHRLFVGAMCAAGTLNVNEFGYPTILLKTANAAAAGLWLIVNRADNRAVDYPLIRRKYGLLLLVAPLLAAETILQGAFFLNLKAHVITSCCGSLFGAGAEGVAATMAGLPPGPMQKLFFGCLALTFGLGSVFLRGRAWAGFAFSAASVITFVVSIGALVSFIALYFYELPTHHCPFCILQREYAYAGYLFYGAMLGGVIPGAGVGVLLPSRHIRSLQGVLPGMLRQLVMISVSSWAVLAAATLLKVLFSDFVLESH